MIAEYVSLEFIVACLRPVHETPIIESPRGTNLARSENPYFITLTRQDQRQRSRRSSSDHSPSHLRIRPQRGRDPFTYKKRDKDPSYRSRR